MLCHMAHNFPAFTENFLDRSATLQKSFREETITDMLIANIVALGGKNVVVDFPNELSTGADMEWTLVDRSDGSFVRLLIQAKRSYGKGKQWGRHSFRELYHQSGTPKALQAKVLCDTARAAAATYPLYIFYVPGKTCKLARLDNALNASGVTLADGYEIEKLAISASDRKTRTKNRSSRTISEKMFPLQSLFCPQSINKIGPMMFSRAASVGPLFFDGTSFGYPTPPTPQKICDAVNRLNDVREKNGAKSTEKQPLDVSFRIPEEIREVLETGKFSSELKASNTICKAVFISRSDDSS
ncbi:DUF6615 family protein [Aliiroseovarius sp. S2029]|uniref:DUF6615 family protein n=1 Tax=Aliiroseovarius sp. S2029 TaxID=2936988 RepID=UPI0020BF0C5A|nr:DUF6615 family protein [Aliiroseovarius sp. S2029]